MSDNNPKISLTSTQQHVLNQMLHFIHSPQQVFILTGYAGTGKTTMMNAFVAELEKRDIHYLLILLSAKHSVLHPNSLTHYSLDDFILVTSPLFVFCYPWR